MAPRAEYAVVEVASTQVLSHDSASILVEAGGYIPMRRFLDSALDSHNSESDDGPPAKKQRTKYKGSSKTVSVKAETIDDEFHIPLFEVCVDLYFPDPRQPAPPPATIREIAATHGHESIRVVPAIIERPGAGHRLKLALKKEKGDVIMVDTAALPNEILVALRQHVPFTSQLRDGGSYYVPERPATLSQCTITASQSPLHSIVRLKATLYWQSRSSAFPLGTPTGRKRIYPDYDSLAQAYPDENRDEADHERAWVPRDFYESVHVPGRNIQVQSDFEGLLESQLFPFQKRAVHWMLKREGMEYIDGRVGKIPVSRLQQDVSFFEPVNDLRGNKCYVNHFLGTLQRDMPIELSSYNLDHLSGGILAEEMGLGKTVELMALLRSHPRPESLQDKVSDVALNSRLLPSRATLVITPASILEQWRTEFATHAPSLKILVYKGIAASKSAKEKPPTLTDLTKGYDVVLATYHTLAKEIHFAEDPPDRNMRHARKFERKSSPLVEIEWWRVCLDEAQMIESGVTAAARVACRIPRVHSWAVSGTPLRKDVQDLHGLLVFLRYKPFSDDVKLWRHLITNHKHIARAIFGSIAIRQTKAHIKDELVLPPQKRIVVNVPFSAIEEQHYSTLFAEMCEAVGVNKEGSPLSNDWNPEDSETVEAMRTFLTRLRQTCLHPQIGGRNRKALGKGQGPLRTVAEVLEVMIDQKETGIRTEERALLASQLTKAHILGNAREDEHRSEKALEIYLHAIETSKRFVKEARERLAVAKAAQEVEGVDTTDEEDSSSEASPILGRLRNNVRTSLQLQHTCLFFAATAYFQIKSNEALTIPDSDRFKELEVEEMQLYERAKVIRKEVLKQNSRKAESLMRKIDELQKKGELVKIPEIVDLDSRGGIESRRIVEKSDMLFDAIREQADTIVAWRTKMAKYLLKPLVDEDEGIETTGDEYEDSTKLQDELYAYFDACKCLQADLHTIISGEAAPLIDHEAKMLVRHAKNMLDETVIADLKVQVHAPELTLELFAIRNKFREEQKNVGSIRGLIQEARGLETSLQGHETGTRASERMLTRQHLSALQSVFSTWTKTMERLEKEIGLFRSTQNQRLEFYRQLQELSDDVKPHKEELDETLDLKGLQEATNREDALSKSLASLKTQNRYLLTLREEAGTQVGPKMCVICTSSFESGVLTVCGHQFCRECIRHWWSQAKSCPVCKRGLALVDFHNITYKPQEIQAQEEVQSGSSSPEDSVMASPSRKQTSIYSSIDTQLLQEIKAIDLPVSYGTKIDALGRHLHWLRSHDAGAKSIIFSQYRDFLDVLGTALRDFKIGYVRLGRGEAVERFKNDASIDCLLLDAKTDSSGLTLVNATHVLLCEPLIQTAVELQAIARVHRIGQTRPTTVWMYLINDTVEESIYEISVARRLAHVQSRQTAMFQKSRSATPAPGPAQENAIELANSEELQSAPLTKLLVAGKGGGEMVGSGDLWQCLFGNSRKRDDVVPSKETEMVVARHLRAEAAEDRRRAGEMND